MRPSSPAPARSTVNPDATRSPAFVLDERNGPTDWPSHAHRRVQLVHAAEGVLTVSTAAGRWVAPPQRAVWIPVGIAHAVTSRRPVRLMTLYVEPGWAPLPDECRVVAVDRLAEERLVAVAAYGFDYAPCGPEERLVRVRLDRLPNPRGGGAAAPASPAQPGAPAHR